MKKILFFFIIIFTFFVSFGVVFSADTGMNLDNGEINGEIIGDNNIKNVKNDLINSNTSKTSSTINISKTSSSTNISKTSSNISSFKITLSHNKVEHGKPISFKVTVKDSNGNPVVGHYFAFSFRSMNDITNPDGRFTNVVYTDANGVFYEYWSGNSGYFDYYELTISDGLDTNQYPTGTVYYRETFDLTLKPNMNMDISKSTIYEGQFTQIKVIVRVNGVPAEGYLLWNYNNGKSVTTKLTNGVSIFKYNSYILGKNPIVVTYIGLGSAIPGYVVSNINKSFNLNVKYAPDLMISKIVKYGNKYKVTVKNIGKGKSTTFNLKLGYKNKYKVVRISSLSSGKSKTVIFNFKYNIYKKYAKYAWINYNNASFEKNTLNNKIKFKSVPYVGLLPDLTITKVSRSGNNIIVDVKNQGNAPSSGFKILVWYGNKNKGKGYLEFDARKFGKFGKKLPAGASASLTLPYIKYKTHSKYYKFININYNKKVKEVNYKNNIKKIKFNI